MTQKEFKDQFDMYIPSNAFTVAEWDAALKSWQPYYDAMSSSAGLPIDKWLYNTSGYLPDFLDTKEQKFGHSRIGNYDHVMIYQFLDTQGNDPGRKGKYTDMYVRNKAVATVADLQDNYEKNIQDLLRKITTAKTLSDIYAVENSSEYVRFSCKTILRKITILCSVMPGSAYPHAFVWFFGEKTLENLAGILGLGPQNKKTFFEYNHEIYERAKDYAGLTAGSTKDEYVKLYSFLLSLIPKISSAKAAAAGAGVAAADEDEETTPKAGEEEGGAGALVAPAASAAGYDYDDPAIVKAGRNLIIYGTPGCGKSHKLNAELASVTEKFRVTFHLDYTYTDFVGQILPEVDAADKVTYKFIPGPFTLALKTAILNKDKEVALVIEEINRGNAASIFGDLFQLLDRDENGISQYELTNEQITGHLKKELKNYKLDYIKIPANLSLYATMNTGDQNVFTLDTAFKRRWEFEKLSNIFNSEDKHQDKCVPGMCKVTWKTFVETINKHMIGGGTLDSEDKQLGKYFVTENQLVDYDNDDKGKRKKFAYKVLEYLWNDVAKFDRDRWFKTDSCKTLDAVIEKWTNGDGKEVFSSKLEFKEKDPGTLAAPAAPAAEPTKGAEE